MKFFFYLCVSVFICGSYAAAEELKAPTVRAWDAYVQTTEARIRKELDSASPFLNLKAPVGGGVVVEKRNPQINVEDGMVHHWAGAIFIPAVTLDRVLAFVQDYNEHSKYFWDVEASKLHSREGDTFQVFMRFRRKKVITVHYNTEHTVIYRRHDAKHASSRSFTTRIAELENPGKSDEREKPAGNDSGYLWRLNSYWRFQEAGGGVYVECESLSLSRSIPAVVAWLIRGYVESVPRESLENTLRQMSAGVRKAGH
jgi:hypothetical protein